MEMVREKERNRQLDGTMVHRMMLIRFAKDLCIYQIKPDWLCYFSTQQHHWYFKHKMISISVFEVKNLIDFEINWQVIPKVLYHSPVSNQLPVSLTSTSCKSVFLLVVKTLV